MSAQDTERAAPATGTKLRPDLFKDSSPPQAWCGKMHRSTWRMIKPAEQSNKQYARGQARDDR